MSTAVAPGWRMGTLSGVPIYLGRSWVLVAALIVFLFGPTVQNLLPGTGLWAYGVALGFALLLLLSVLVHEAAHALVAQRVGYRVSRIVADFWGGHTAHDGAGGSPGSSAAVAAVGPLSNGALALVGWWAMGLFDGGVGLLLALAFTYANAFVAIVNAIPGLPLDGGFLLEALVWRITGQRAIGTIVAGWAGRLIVIAVVGWLLVPVLMGVEPLTITRLLWVGLIAVFLWQGASQAVRLGRRSLVTSRRTVGSVARPAGQVSRAASLASVDWSAPGLRVVVDESGMPVGIIDPQSLVRVPAPARASTPVSAVTVGLPDGWDVRAAPQDSLAGVVEVMQATRSGVIAVLDEQDRVWGVVLADDLERRS